MIPIFCYGSNMLTERLSRRAPSAHLPVPAVLRGHGISFHKRGQDGSGKCTVQPSHPARRVVHGVVFRVHPEHLGQLHAAEGVGNGYLFQPVAVVTPRGEIHAHAYVASPDAVDRELLPFDWYRDLVVRGAHEHGLPRSYTSRLRRVRCVTDPEAERALLHREIIEASRSIPGGWTDG